MMGTLLVAPFTSTGAPFRHVATHISDLRFTDDRVYKRKKPVTFRFVDFSTPEARLAACHNEVDLNRRLAPDVYLGVDEIRDSHGNLTDAEVVMRRLPDDRRLATLVSDGVGVAEDLTDVARAIAAFHSRATRGSEIDAVATRAGLQARWDADLDEWEPLVREYLDYPGLSRERRLVHRYLAGRESLLNQRIAGGHIVDGHGDLLAADIFCMDDGPRILDCLEFSPSLRYGDELADVAFLAMDLESLGRIDLAAHFVATYSRFAGEHFPASLLHLYIAQRAMVRSKVACLRLAAGDLEATPEARAHLNLCSRHLELARSILVVVGGAPGTGKSTLATRLTGTMGWVHLRSDEIRRDVAGVRRGVREFRDPLYSGLYTSNSTHATYRAMLGRATALLRAGQSVVLDATFAAVDTRLDAREVGHVTYADVVEIECQAPMAAIRDRVRRRRRRNDDASEAGPAVALALHRRQATWPAAHPIDSTMSDAAQLVRCLRHVGETPVGDEPR